MMKDPLLTSSVTLQPAQVFTTAGSYATPSYSSKQLADVICVSGSSSKIVEPDVCHSEFELTSKPKVSAQEAKESVIRREDYVKQVLQNNACKVSQVE